MRARRHEHRGRDDVGNLGLEDRLICEVGPTNVAGLHPEMQLVADIRTGVVIAVCRTMPCSCIRVGGVDPPAVLSDTEHLCLSHGLLGRRRLLDQLGIDSLAVQFDGIDRSLECTQVSMSVPSTATERLER